MKEVVRGKQQATLHKQLQQWHFYSFVALPNATPLSRNGGGTRQNAAFQRVGLELEGGKRQREQSAFAIRDTQAEAKPKLSSEDERGEKKISSFLPLLSLLSASLSYSRRRRCGTIFFLPSLKTKPEQSSPTHTLQFKSNSLKSGIFARSSIS